MWRSFALIALFVLLFIPQLVGAQAGLVPPPCDGRTYQLFDFARLISNLLNYAVFVATVVATVLIVIAGFRYLSAGINPSAIESAKRLLINVLIGFVFIIAAWLIVNTIIRVFVPGTTAIPLWQGISCVAQPLPTNAPPGSGVGLPPPSSSQITEDGVLLGYDYPVFCVNEVNGNCLQWNDDPGYEGEGMLHPDQENFQGVICVDYDSVDRVCNQYNDDPDYRGAFMMNPDQQNNPGSYCVDYNETTSSCEIYSDDPLAASYLNDTGSPGLGAPTTAGACPTMASGECSPSNLSSASSILPASTFSAICRRESGGISTVQPTTDRLWYDNRGFSYGLFQINLTQSPLNCNGQNLNCPSAFELVDTSCRTASWCPANRPACACGRAGFGYRVTNDTLYQQCIQAAQNPQCNIRRAEQLYQQRGLQPWYTTVNRCQIQ